MEDRKSQLAKQNNDVHDDDPIASLATRSYTVTVQLATLSEMKSNREWKNTPK